MVYASNMINEACELFSDVESAEILELEPVATEKKASNKFSLSAIAERAVS